MIQEQLISIGADPEFLIVDKNSLEVIPANTLFARGSKASVGCDGNSRVGELRPNFAYDAVTLTKTIRKLLCKVKSSINNHSYIIVGGSGYKGFATGGHIHFGVRHSYNLIKAFDLATIMLNSSCDKKLVSNRRQNYGMLNNYENKQYGFEYRTLDSWLATPQITMGILALYHSIVIESRINENQFNEWVNMYDNIHKRIGQNKFISGWKQSQVRMFMRFKYDILQLCKNLETVKQDYYGYKDIILRLLERIEKGVKLPNIIDEKAWGLEILQERKERIYDILDFNLDDIEMNNIASQIQQKKVKKSEVIRIFGTTIDKNVEVVYSLSVNEISEIITFCANNNMTCFQTPVSGKKFIGLRLDTRQNKKTEIINMLQQIINMEER